MNKTNQHSILKAEKVCIGYRSKNGETPIARNIDFSINEGELTAIVGVNGAGKSTLLKTLTQELSPLAGGIFIKGFPLQNYSTKKLSETMSVVLTNQGISQNLNVFELVALGRQPYTNWLGSLDKEGHDAVINALKQVELTELAHKKCGELSDGQLQKALIARALTQDTALIFMDEPTTHLDLYHKAYVLRLLKKLTQETKKAIVFASHEINLAIRLCDKIILINQAETVCGSPEELIKNGNFESLFPLEIIEFHKESRSFRIKA